MDDRITITVNAPIEKTFSLVDDAEKLKLWMDGLMDTEYTSPSDPANPLGTTFRQKIKEGGRVTEYEGEVTATRSPTGWPSASATATSTATWTTASRRKDRRRGPATPARSPCTPCWQG